MQAGHVFAAKALRGNGNRQLIALYKAQVENSRGIVIGIHPANGIADYAFAQKTLRIAQRHALVDCVRQQTTGNVCILP